MNEEKESQAVFEDVCRVIGRVVIMLKQSNQDVNNSTISLMLQAHSGKRSNTHLQKIYAAARDIMKDGADLGG